jgi:hypothetical protein
VEELDMLNIELGDAQDVGDLTVVPLVHRGPADLPCDLLSDALEDGRVVVGEIGEGSVPTLRVENGGARDVLVLDGEQLIGAKQNRTTNRSIVLGAKEVTEIPVSCMEQGRWSFKDRHFQSAMDHSPAKVRRRAREMEQAAVQRRRSASPAVLAEAQSGVWEEIGDLSSKLGVASETGALDEAYGARRADLEGWADGLDVVEGQVGLMVLAPDGPLGLDVVGSHRLYAKVHRRLLRGALMDGLDRGALSGDREVPYQFAEAEVPVSGSGTSERVARRFLGRIAAARRTEAPTVGRGSYRVLTRGIVGGELVFEGRLAHVSAFPTRRERSHGRRDR